MDILRIDFYEDGFEITMWYIEHTNLQFFEIIS